MKKIRPLFLLTTAIAAMLTIGCKKQIEEIYIPVEKQVGSVVGVIRTSGLIQDYAQSNLPLLPLDSVKVTLTSKDTSIATYSDKQGVISFSNVRPGTYHATVERTVSSTNIKHEIDITVEQGKTSYLKNYMFDCFFFQLEKPQKKRWTFIHFANLTDPALSANTVSEIRIQEKFGGSGEQLHNVAYLSAGVSAFPSILYLQKTPFAVDPDDIHTGPIPPRLFSPRYYFNSVNNADFKTDGDPGDYRQLEKIIRGVTELYPSDSIALFIYDHGSGIAIDDMESTTKSISYNPYTDIGISVPQLREVIQNVKPIANISALIMDACFMGMYEVAYEMKNTNIKYILASPPSMGAMSSNEAPEYIEKMGNSEWSLAQMCYEIIDKTVSDQFALYNMTYLGDMTALINDFAAKLNKTEAIYIDAAVNNSKVYSNNKFEILSCFYDLGYFANEMTQLAFEDPAGVIPAAQKVADYIKNPGQGKFLERIKINPSNKWPTYGIAVFMRNPQIGDGEFSLFRKMYQQHQYYKDGNKDWDAMLDKIGTSTITPWDGTIRKPTIKDDLVHINTPSELAWVAQQTNSGSNNFSGMIIKLNTSIDLGGYKKQVWTPIGTQEHPFKGTFDGGSTSEIVNLYIPGTISATDIGLFGYIDGGEIKNCNIYDCDILIDKPSNTTIEFNVGGICGRTTSTTSLAAITDCSISGGVVIYDAKVLVNIGGIVGRVDKNATIDRCISYAQVSARNSTQPVAVGGICGAVISGSGMSSITISNCFTEFCNTRAESTLADATAGGIVGELSGDNISIIHCESHVSHVMAKGKQYSAAGGMIGSSTSTSAQVICCYNSSDVSSQVTEAGNYSTSSAGGICGTGMISIFTCENIGTIKEGQYRANMLGSGSGIISSCCATDSTNGVFGIISKVEASTKLFDCYYTSVSAVGTGSATITDCFKFSAEHWPTATLKGWGDTAPAGWTNGTWSNPWGFIGSPNDLNKFPTLKRLR